MTLHDQLTPELNRIRAELEALRKIKIHIGIQGAPGKGREQNAVPAAPADLLTIAGVHEYGATIHAKNAKNLAIPLRKEAQGKSPRDFPGLFFIEGESGKVFGCVMKGNRKNKDNPDNLKFLFMLLPSVTIPERSFIRAGYDNNQERLAEVCRVAMSHVIRDGWDATKAAEYIGGRAVGFIMEYITEMRSPAKGEITKQLSNWPDNPLMESGRLRNSISFRLEVA